MLVFFEAAAGPWAKAEPARLARRRAGLWRLPKSRTGNGMMAEDATALVEALLAIIDAARAYLPPDGIGKDEFIARVLEATDNPRIIAAVAAQGHPVAG